MEENHNKNCIMYKYIPTKLCKVSRIIAIGDIHGDIKLALKLLKLAKVIRIINKKLVWIGKDTYVIQTGDQLDSCRPINKQPCYTSFNKNKKGNIKKSDIHVLKLFTRLDFLAQLHGGRVISLLGNHEIINVLGNMFYVSQDDIEYFSNIEERIKLFKPGNEFAKLLGCTRLLFVIIGNNFFCHGGLVKQFIDKIKKDNEDPITTLNRLNDIFKKWLITGKKEDKKLINLTTMENESMSDTGNSILWERILGSISSNLPISDIECTNNFVPIMKMLDLQNMIIGHTPQIFINKTSINGTCDKHLWRIDTALSHAFDEIIKEVCENKFKKKLQVLEIIDDNIFNIISEK